MNLRIKHSSLSDTVHQLHQKSAFKNTIKEVLLKLTDSKVIFSD